MCVCVCVCVYKLLTPSPYLHTRNYIVLAISESIQEIIRVLQLTTPTEEGAFAAEQGMDQAGLPGGMLPGSLAAKVYQAKELVTQTGIYMYMCTYTHAHVHRKSCAQSTTEHRQGNRKGEKVSIALTTRVLYVFMYIMYNTCTWKICV